MTFRLLAIFLSLFILPGLVRGITGRSMALGILLGLLVMIVCHVKTYRSIFTRISFLYAVALVLIIGFINSPHFTVYSTGTLFTLIVFIFSCVFIAGSFELSSSIVLDRHVYLVLLFFLVISIVQIGSDFQFLQYSSFPKTLAFYSEPSHLIIGLSPLVMFSFMRCGNHGKFFIFVSLMFVGIFSPSVISLFLVVFLLPLWLGPKHQLLRLFALAPIISLGVFVTSQLGDSVYISSRLDFSAEDNLTVLTYLQGWEEIKRILSSEHYLGVGIGNSTDWSVGAYGELIYKLLGDYKNREDLGFLAAKTIVELGWAGLILILYLSLISIRSYCFLFMKTSFKKFDINHPSSVELMAHASLSSFLLELFVRGSGYISSGVFLFILGSIIINKTQIRFLKKHRI